MTWRTSCPERNAQRQKPLPDIHVHSLHAEAFVAQTTCPRRAVTTTSKYRNLAAGHHCGWPAWGRDSIDQRSPETSSGSGENAFLTSNLVMIIARRGEKPQRGEKSLKSTPMRRVPVLAPTDVAPIVNKVQCPRCPCPLVTVQSTARSTGHWK